MDVTVLICDDNIAVHESLAVYLKEDYIQVLSAYTGKAALEMIRSREINFVILDLMLPDISGLDVLKELRSFSDVPVLILSAKGAELDRIIGLELGADDYIAKPFSAREIATRISVILRRTGPRKKNRLIQYRNLTVDMESYTCQIDGESLDLTPKELKVLAILAETPGKVFSRDYLLNQVWGYEYFIDERAVDTQVKRIRQKLPETASIEIRSVYGVGYKLEGK